jgi:hypothetical protein
MKNKKLNMVGNWSTLKEQPPLIYEERVINATGQNSHKSELKFSAGKE